MNLENKRILFVQHAGTGGAVVSLSQIIEKLASQRCHITVLLLRDDPKTVKLFKKIDCDVIVRDRMSQVRYVFGGWSLREPLGLYFTLRSILFLKRSLKEFRKIVQDIRPDLIYLNALPVCQYASPAKKLGVPVILHVREIVRDGLFGIPKRLYRHTIENSVNHTIFIGEQEYQQIAPRSTHSIIPNYVCTETWHPKPIVSPSTLSTDSTQIVSIIFVGGLNSIKGIQILLPALTIIKESFHKFQCVFLGIEKKTPAKLSILRRCLFPIKGMTYEQVLTYVQQKGLSDHCIFKSFVENPAQEFQNADILVFPSTVPHFPRPLVEAGAMALPVITSNWPGPSSIVSHGKNGLLIPPDSPKALADALLILLHNTTLRREMGHANYEIIKENFNDAINSQQIIETINRLTTDT